MLFNSWQFLFVFLPIAVGVFQLIPRSDLINRKGWLVALSFVFYGAWKPEYTLLLAGSICFNYTVSECLARCRSGGGSGLPRGLIIVGVSGNVLLLAYFKYTNFLAGIVNHVTGAGLAPFEIILPLAISFFTFTQIAYLVDVYRKRSLHYGILDYTELKYLCIRQLYF